MNKYVKYGVTIILIVISLSSIFLGRYLIKDSFGAASDEEISSYILKSEKLVVYSSCLDVYPQLDSKFSEGYEIPHGTEIEVELPLTIHSETKRIPVIIYDNNEGKEVFIEQYALYSETTSDSESILIKLCKKVSYMAGDITKIIMSSKRYIIITLIISALLILGDPVIESVWESFEQVSERVSMISLILPAGIYLLLGCVCEIIDKEKYKQLLCDGLVLLPKDDMFMSWLNYISTIIFLIIAFKTICRLYINYNPIIAIIKFITAFILTFIFMIASLYALFTILGIVIVLLVIGVIASTRTVVIER